MNERIFLIGIGGTGMRCLESFVHLCGMGMFDNTEVEMLALDTDRNNGNFRRLAELVHAYRGIKGVNKDHHSYSETFFSAKINYYQYSPDYARTETSNFNRLTGFTDLTRQDKEKADLAKLLLTDNTREFDLKHGYRAQTNLGSFLMYHNILEEVRQNIDGDLRRYIQNLVNAGQAKVFVMGSVFGGTGASSIPVIPKAFAAAVEEISPGQKLDAYFGASLLTSYFSFTAPSADYVQKQKIVATAEKFALNSQAAMMFYNEDNTVKQTYQRFYMLGTPGIEFSTSQGETDTITGGEKQRNNAHYIELLSAFSAYDFFHYGLDELDRMRRDGNGVEYFYRTVDKDGVLAFPDFVGKEKAGQFAHRLGTFVAMSYLVLISEFVKAAKAGVLKDVNVEGYEELKPEEVEAFQRYFELFNFALKDGSLSNGWLRQLYQSAGGGDRFLFLPDMFGAGTEKELKGLKYNGKMFKEDYEKHHFGKSLFGYKEPFDLFKGAFSKTENDENVTNRSERLVKRIYLALKNLYEF